MGIGAILATPNTFRSPVPSTSAPPSIAVANIHWLSGSVLGQGTGFAAGFLWLCWPGEGIVGLAPCLFVSNIKTSRLSDYYSLS
jgi:hypothetical protein